MIQTIPISTLVKYFFYRLKLRAILTVITFLFFSHGLVMYFWAFWTVSTCLSQIPVHVLTCWHGFVKLIRFALLGTDLLSFVFLSYFNSNHLFLFQVRASVFPCCHGLSFWHGFAMLGREQLAMLGRDFGGVAMGMIPGLWSGKTRLGLLECVRATSGIIPIAFISKYVIERTMAKSIFLVLEPILGDLEERVDQYQQCSTRSQKRQNGRK